MPGLKPIYRPTFTPDQIVAAKRLSKKQAAPFAVVQRAKLILLLAQQPDIENPVAARRLGRHENWVRVWRKRWVVSGFSLEDQPRTGRPRIYTIQDHTQIKALACEFPAQREQPLSRYSTSDLVRLIQDEKNIGRMSGSTIWRILAHDAIKPWRFRLWIFPRDPQFLDKAGPILDLYQGLWQGQALGSREFVLSADEKTSIQARRRTHASHPCNPRQLALFEHEYERQGAIQYLAALDVHRMKIFGRCEARTGKASFGRLVDQVMRQEPYVSAERVFWIVDNGSSHRGPKSVAELKEKYPQLTLLHLPVHASWLNQIEIYFSIVQRKVLTPNDFENLQVLTERILAFQEYYVQNAQPFNWRYTRDDLKRQYQRLQFAT